MQTNRKVSREIIYTKQLTEDNSDIYKNSQKEHRQLYETMTINKTHRYTNIIN